MPGAGLAAHLAAAVDPVAFALRAGFAADPWQAELLRSTAPRVILNCSRQAGKTEACAALAAHELATVTRATVLMLAPAQRQARELYRRTRAILDAVGELAPPLTSETANGLELLGGARALVLPGTGATVRGYSPTLVLVDEAAFVDDGLLDSVRPMLAVSRGRLVLLSTPNGQRGAFYEAWAHGGAEWQRVRVPATECPRIDPAWLARERRSLPAHVFAQEYLCEFGDADAQLFSGAIVRRALTDELSPLFPERN